jgi:hypothetical protein
VLRTCQIRLADGDRAVSSARMSTAGLTRLELDLPLPEILMTCFLQIKVGDASGLMVALEEDRTYA